MSFKCPIEGFKFMRMTSKLVVFFLLGVFVFTLMIEMSDIGSRFQTPKVAGTNSLTNGQNCRDKVSNMSWKFQPIENWTFLQMVDYLEWTNSSSCDQRNDFGGAVVYTVGVTGQKAVCLDGHVKPEESGETWPVRKTKKSKECLVYSFGINNEWSFDEAMEAYGCQVYSFDPSMNVTSHNHSSKIHFYDLGLSDRDETWNNVTQNKGLWNMRSLDSIYRKLLRHEGRIIDYLKIDIENTEWIVLPQILNSGMMDRVRQLGVEIHFIPEEESRLEDIRQRIKIIKSLEDYGLVRFESKYNPWSYSLNTIDNFDWMGNNCYEIAWYNSRLSRQYKKSKKL